MKIISFFLFGFLFFSFLQPVSAQLDSFDLSRYKLPEIKRKQLDFNFNSNLQQGIDNTQSYKSLNAYGSISAGYRTFTNLEKYQGSSVIQLSVTPQVVSYSQSNSSNNYEQRYNRLNDGLTFDFENRFFLMDEYFWEVDVTGTFIQQNYSSLYKNFDFSNALLSKTDQDYANTNSNFNTALLFGKGRIEPVEDARLAVYILDDLQKLNKLSHLPNETEILEFSALISKLKNKRYFDYRLHKIQELKEIDTFLREKGLVKDNDIAYFSAVNDNWDYAAGPQRLSGSKFFGGIIPGVSLNTDLEHSYYYDGNSVLINSTKTAHNDSYFNMSYMAGYQYNKPIKLSWQISAGITAEYMGARGQIYYPVSTNKTKLKYNNFIPREYASIGYFPNSRTSLTAGLSLSQSFDRSYTYNTPNSSWDPDQKINSYSGSLDFSLYYYISPQLRLNGSWHLNPAYIYYVEPKSGKSQFNQNLNLGVIYSIF